MNKIEVTHDFSEESIEAKTLWFKSLSISQRIDVICSFTDLSLELNPKLADKPNDQQTDRSIQVLSRA